MCTKEASPSGEGSGKSGKGCGCEDQLPVGPGDAVAIALECVEMRNACGFDWCGFCVARTHVRVSYL